MKKKDIITLVVSGLIIVGCLIFVVMYFFPSVGAQPKASVKTTTTETETKITADGVNSKDNQELIDKINNLKEYGETNLQDIGKSNPFAPLN